MKMKTFFKLVTLFAAVAGVVLIVMKLLEADKRRADDKKRIAMFKGGFSIPVLRKREIGQEDEIADYRNGDDDELTVSASAEDAANESKFDDIFEEDGEQPMQEDSDPDDISEDILLQILDS